MPTKPSILGWRNDWGGRGDGTKDIYGGTSYYRIVKPLQFLHDQYTITSFGRCPIIQDYETGKIVPPQETFPYLISKSDLVFMKNVSNPMGLMQLCGAAEHYNVPLILDMDDDYFHVDELSAKFEDFQNDTMAQSVHRTLFRSVTAMTVSCEKLVEVYKPYCKNIHVLPNYNDIQDWKFTKKQNKRLTIGWCGSPTHESDLMLILPTLKKLWERYGGKIQFAFGNAYPLDIYKYVPKEAVVIHSGKDDILDYMPALANWGFDIGLAPLAKNTFNLSKGHGKWMEYAMYKIPTVASNYGPYTYTMKDGVDGFLVEDEWFERVCALIDSKELREEIGNAAYTSVKRDWQWKDHAHTWGSVFDQYLGKGFK